MQRKLIEHDILLAETSEAPAWEKSIRHGTPSELTKMNWSIERS